MNEIPKIETFEHDIVEEVQSKNTSIADLASYSGKLNNNEKEKSRKINFILMTISILLIILSLVVIVVYLISSKNTSSTTQTVTENNQNKFQINEGSKNKIVTLFPNLNANVGMFISNFEVTPFGYIVTLSDFRQVYAFIIKNENVFAEDAINSFAINPGENITKNDLVFKDITESNQNMRILEINGITIVYSWLNNEHLLISKSINGILSMRSAIIK